MTRPGAGEEGRHNHQLWRTEPVESGFAEIGQGVERAEYARCMSGRVERLVHQSDQHGDIHADSQRQQ